MITTARSWKGAAMLTARYTAFRAREPRRRRWSLEDRLAALPRQGLPLDAGVEIRWNDRHVPFVEAAGQRDLAVGLGVVHGHLRLFQMEIMRRLARGRMAGLLGPVALDVDRSLRIVGFSRAVEEIRQGLPEETREWLAGFRDGVNAVIESADEHPEEFRLLGAAPEPWTLGDLVAIGRVAASDFSWKVLRRLLPHSDHEYWPAVWERLIAEGGSPVPSYAGNGRNPGPEDFLAAFGRGGSNSLAVAGERTKSGAAMIASDPHLGVMLPNLWLIAGMRAPGIHAVGLMIPGVPVMALGRNEHIAWGGTSLHAASSDLFDVTDLPDGEIATREETIPVRWGGEGRVTIRECAYGPIISDAPMLGLPKDRPLAMRWIGHDPNDEISAMLGVQRARDWDEFRSALDGFAAPAQTMVFADTRGRVGKAIAAHLPRRGAGPPADIVRKREFLDHWREIVVGSDFPAEFAPERGYVASANNRPPPSDVPVGFFFSSNDRVDRMSRLLDGLSEGGPDDLKALQRDVAMPSSERIRRGMLAVLDTQAADTPGVVGALASWNGRHEADSRGALAYELMVHHLLRHLHAAYELALYLAAWDLTAQLARDLEELPRPRLEKAATRAARDAQADFRRHRTWGAIHRMRLEHPFARVPVIGRSYRFSDDAIGGGNETLMKTAHGVARDTHRVGLGQVARHVSDLSDPDANDFCLLGGQDGWIGSDSFNDQYALWRDGRYVRVPMSRSSVAREFRHVVTLSPAGAGHREHRHG
jgi:penicillin amidase